MLLCALPPLNPDPIFCSKAWQRDPELRPSFSSVIDLLLYAWNSDTVQSIARLQGVRPSEQVNRVSQLKLKCDML